MGFVERTFPRGGEIPKKKHENTDGKQQHFGVISKKPRTTKKKNKKSDKKNDTGVAKDESFESRKAELITAKTLTEGMLLMGYVKSVLSSDIIVSLPGRLQGKISINNISNPYTKCLQSMVDGGEQICKSLEELFQPGQELYVKVLSVTKKDNENKKIELSVNPADLHSELHHTKLQPGFTLCGSVESIEDHGYIVDLGIGNVRAFLPSKELPNQKLSIGELIFCTLTKVKSTSSVTTVQLKSCSKKKILEVVSEAQLDYIVPTITVKFIIMNVVKNGIMGKILDGEYTAYINEVHLGQGKSVKDFEIGKEIEAKILYVMPLTKFVYLTLNSFTAPEKRIMYGRIMENVEILGKSQNGILLKLSNKAKGLISYAHMKIGVKVNVDEDELIKKYSQAKLPVVRVMDYNPVDDIYICTDKANLIQEKYFSFLDAQVGEFVQAKITKKVPGKGLAILVGQLHGFIYQPHATKAVLNQKVGSKIRGRILSIDEVYKKVVVTTRTEYLKDNAKIMINREQLSVGDSYIGLIHDVHPKKILIQFFNRIIGAIIKSDDPVNKSFYDSMKPGQIVRVTVKKFSNQFITLSLTRHSSEDTIKMGKVFNAKVLNPYSSGLDVEAVDSKANIWISNHYVSESENLCSQVSASMNESSTIRVVRLSDEIYSIRDVDHFYKFKMSSWKSLKAGIVLRGFVKNIHQDCLEIHLPLADMSKTVKIFYPMILKNYQEGDEQNLFHPEQIIHVKVISKENNTKTIGCSALLSQVWNGSISIPAKILSNYFKELEIIYSKMDLKLKTSDKINGVVEEITEEGVAVKIKGHSKMRGFIPHDLLDKTPEIGETLQCVVIWISPEGLVYLTNKPDHAEMRENKDHLQFSHMKQKGEILLKTGHFFVVLLESNHVVYIPLRLHYNDFQPLLGDRKGSCEIILLNDRSERVIAMFKDIFEECRKFDGEKRKRQESLSESDREEASPKKAKLEVKDELTDVEETTPMEVEKTLDANFWSTDFSWLPSAARDESEKESETSDSEDDTPKRKLTARERLEQAKMNEARIRQREESLADGISDPQSTEDFERLVLTTPNNSFIWIKYMVHQLQATEVEKARSVARRAIQTISYREQDELVNMWVALLNLELRFGIRDTFEAVLAEALEVNDQFKITMRTIEILADVRKIDEMKAKISIAMKKFKENAEMWSKIGAAFFTVGLANEAKQMMHRAIAALPQRDHIFIISSFAKLHNKHGERETAHALLEQIITSYPKRVDIWSMYVDMLVKDSRQDLARDVLDRAILQKLPLKKMRTLFKKYQEFEEKYGDEQSVEKIKTMAEEFVQNYIKT
ncbi:RRP5 [Sergentomyia squamirostris]